MDLRAAVEALRSLGKAGSVEEFAKHEEHIDWLHAQILTRQGYARQNDIPPSLAQLFEQGLISWLSAAVCRALFLMQLSPTIMAKAICSIANLCSVTGLCAEACTSRDVHAGQLQSDMLNLAQRVAKTDLLTYLAQMCTFTADQLQLPAVTQLSPVQLHCSLGLGYGLLQLFVSLARSWPGKVLTGKTIARAVQPAVKLAAAVLDCLQVAVPVSSSSSSSSASSSDLEQLWRSASRPAGAVGDVLAAAMNNEVVGEQMVVKVGTAQPCLCPTAQLLATADVRRLLKVNVAVYAMLLYQQHQQQQRVTAGQLEVPPYHLELFSALGLARYGTHQSHNPIPADAATVAVNAVLISTMFWQQQSTSTTSSTSSTASRASSSTNTVAGQTQLSPELLPLLLTVLEVQLLAVDAGVMNASLQLMHMLIEEIYKTQGDISLVAPPGQQQTLGIEQVLAAKAALRNVLAAIAGPVLLSLAPAVAQLLRSSSSSSSSGGNQQQQQQQQDIELDLAGSHFVALMVCMAVTGKASSTAQLLQQQPVACSSAFETALRLAAAKEQLPELYNMQVWQLHDMPPAAVRAQFALTVISLVTAAAVGPPSAPAARATPQQQPLLQLEVCSLLTSYVKYVTLLAAKPPHSTWGPLQLINPMLQLPKYLVSSSSSSSSGSSGGSGVSSRGSSGDKDAASVTLLEVLLARCLMAAGCFLDTWCSAVGPDAAAAATAAAAAAAEALHPQGIKHVDSTLNAAAAAVSWLCDQLQRQCTAVAAPSARSASVLQDLVSQGRQLADALLRANQQLASSSSSSSDSSAAAVQLQSADVVQQLQQFGAGVCAQLPCRHCCNHPACVNMAKTSELELVGGKSCICAGCKVARYCGKDCQVAHWKAHKRVCKQLQAAQ